MYIMIDKSIVPPSYSFVFLNGLTLSLIYAKNIGDMYIGWFSVLFPSFFYLFLQLIFSLKDIYYLETNDIKIPINQIKLIMLSRFSNVVLCSTLTIFLFMLSEYLNFYDISKNSSENYSTYHFYVIILFFLIELFIYTFLVNQLDIKEEEDSTSLKSIIINSIFAILGNTFTICGSGACTSIYVSTVSAFFSAFGITIVDWIPYLRFSVIIFIAISLISIYSSKKSILYPCFIASFFGSVIIILSMIYEKIYFLYFGNIIMIAAAYWNSKLNKASFSRKKKETV